MAHVLVWDLETIPDLKGFAAANGHDGKTEDEIGVGRQIPQAHRPLAAASLLAPGIAA
jgi:hypothetical protein